MRFFPTKKISLENLFEKNKNLPEDYKNHLINSDILKIKKNMDINIYEKELVQSLSLDKENINTNIFLDKKDLYLMKYFESNLSKAISSSAEPNVSEYELTLFRYFEFFGSEQRVESQPSKTISSSAANLSEHELTLSKYFDFLQSKEQIEKQLCKLEIELRENAQKLKLLDTDQKHLKGYKKEKHFKQHKLLSGTLNAWAHANGFADTLTLNTVSPIRLFLNVLKEGHPFKDSAFRGVGHGEWTHFIQLYCIGKRHEEQPFSSITPIKMLEWLGSQKDTTFWNAVFEGVAANAGKVVVTGAFGSVFNFNEYLLSEECEENFPILHQLLYSRAHKADLQYDSKNNLAFS